MSLALYACSIGTVTNLSICTTIITYLKLRSMYVGMHYNKLHHSETTFK